MINRQVRIRNRLFRVSVIPAPAPVIPGIEVDPTTSAGDSVRAMEYGEPYRSRDTKPPSCADALPGGGFYALRDYFMKRYSSV